MKKTSAFIDIRNINELLVFLEDRSTSSPIIYQYTNIEALAEIKTNRFLLLGNVMEMNDLYEYKLSKSTQRKRSYIASFSRENNENIAMWAMYANPWNKGVRIGFNSSKLKKLLQNTEYVYEVDDKFNIVDTIPITPVEKTLTCVAYFKESDNRLDWSNKRLYLNSLQGFEKLTSNPVLHGYIKHKAWSFENEVRMMIRLNDHQVYKRIGIKLTQDLIEDIEIMTGPSVSAYMKDKHSKLLQRSIKSEFEGLIKLKEIFSGKDV